MTVRSRRPRPLRTLRPLVVLVAAALVATACSLPGQITGSREITATFDDVGDLVNGHSVQVADVRIGSVTDIELTDDYRARVTMSIKDDVFIPSDASARLRTTSLLGEKFIELVPPNPDEPLAGENIADQARIDNTDAAPELELVAGRAVEVLGAVMTDDLQTLVETGSQGFGNRGPELASLVDNLSVVSGTLADQTDEIVRIIDALDSASAALAGGSTQIDQLLVNLAETTQVLADSRDNTISAVEELTRLAQVQNDNILEPYLDQVNEQIEYLDAILGELDRDQGQVAEVLGWLAEYIVDVPASAPGDFIQISALFEVLL